MRGSDGWDHYLFVRPGSAVKIARDPADKSGVSRFHKMQGNSFRVWSPPGSRYRIEYSNALLREVRTQSAQADAFGLLYGVRDDATIRVIAARLSADATDPRLACLEQIGIFASRVRGEVFLTEADLERFEKMQTSGAVALVIAGGKGGFFVPEPDGSLQSIKSHLEFSLSEPLPVVGLPADGLPAEAPRAGQAPRTRPRWHVSLMAAGIAISIACAAFWTIHFTRRSPAPPPLALSVQEEGGALRIAWNPRAILGAATLEINDGGARQSIDAASLASVVYVRHSGDVFVGLAGASAHFVGGEPPVSPLDRVRQQVAELDGEVQDLRTTAAIRARRAAEIEKILTKMDLAH